MSQIENHVKEYGEAGKGYGLGMSIDWAFRNDISPVTYTPVRNMNPDQISTSVYVLHQNIHSFLTFSIGVPNAGEDPNANMPYKSLLYKIYPELVQLMAYLKPYIGLQNGKVRKFYDEKEWRYIPSREKLPNQNPMFRRIPDYGDVDITEFSGLSIFAEAYTRYYGMSIKDALNMAIEHIRKQYLTFDPKDIKYIIVHSEDEIIEIIDKLKSLPYKYSETQRQIITSKIVTYEQISEDF